MLLNYQGSIFAAILGLVLAAYFANRILAINVSDEKVSNLSDAIRKGSMAFLKRQYSWISIFVLVLAILIPTLTELGIWGSVSFIGGAAFSSLAGFIGMRIATAANGRTTEAARDGGTLKALPVAFRGGAVMGFSVAGLGLLGVGLGYWIFVELLELENAYDILAAIGLGGSSIALFARVGGGIYTKAADVGADLVGKYVSALGAMGKGLNTSLIGIGMSPRGEVGLIFVAVATTTLSDIITGDIISIIIWMVIVTTVIAPILLNRILQKVPLSERDDDERFETPVVE